MKNLSHISSLQAKKEETMITAIVASILDIEAIYQQNFKNSLDSEMDLFALKKCKTELSILLKNLNLYNLYLSPDKLVYKQINNFTNINELPRLRLQFNQRDKEFPFENQSVIDAENKQVEETLDVINSLLKDMPVSNISDVRKKYVTSEDGFLFTINISDSPTNKKIVSVLSDFKTEVSNLTLDELMISQQFTDSFKVEYINPYWLETNKNNLDAKQNILISIKRIECSAPFYYFQKIIDHLIHIIEVEVNNSITLNQEYTNLVLSYNSLNQSYVYCNLNIKLEKPDD